MSVYLKVAISCGKVRETQDSKNLGTRKSVK